MEHIKSLDGVRALAVIIVVAFHVRMPGFYGGFIGVDIFFVLSGFLVTSMLFHEREKTGRISVKGFYARRFIRLYPALLLFLLVFAVTAPFLFAEINLLQEVLLSGLFVADYSRVFFKAPVITQHTWSLAVEMHFYVIWPFLVIWLGRFQRRQAIQILIAGFVMATVWRMASFEIFGWARAYNSFDTRMSGFLIGGVLALVEWRPNAGLADRIAAGSIGVIVAGGIVLRFYSWTANTLGGILVDLAAAALILSVTVSGSRIAAFFASPIPVRIGLWSYGIYIWHYPIARLTRVNMDGASAFLVTMSVSLILAGFSFEYFEKPISKWLRSYL